MSSQSTVLTIKDIASWAMESTLDATPPFVASIPTLQRGSVWRPSQTELLWDSLLRGFPVGAIVVVKKVAEQEKSKSRQDSTHHLLDGQQRCNAIALAFQEPNENSGSILWLDLLPEFPKKNTRSFLVKVTNRSHPWGFTSTDDCDRLGFGHIRASLEDAGLPLPHETEYVKPSPFQMKPFTAKLPVPLFYLIESYHSDPIVFWSGLLDKFRLPEFKRWASDKLLEFIISTDAVNIANRNRTHLAITKLLKREFVALSADDLILEENRLEGGGD